MSSLQPHIANTIAMMMLAEICSRYYLCVSAAVRILSDWFQIRLITALVATPPSCAQYEHDKKGAACTVVNISNHSVPL